MLQLTKLRKLHHRAILSVDSPRSLSNSAKQLPAKPRELPVQLPTPQRKLLPQAILLQICSASHRRSQMLLLARLRKLHHPAILSVDSPQSLSNSAKQLPAKPRELPVQLLTLQKKLLPQATLLVICSVSLKRSQTLQLTKPRKQRLQAIL